jgi:hypothetical protein
MNRKQFLVYVDHFNNHRFDKVVSYFCPDVTLAYPDNFMGPQIPGVTGNTLHGPKEFIANYEAIAANVREVLNVGAFFLGAGSSAWNSLPSSTFCELLQQAPRAPNGRRGTSLS